MKLLNLFVLIICCSNISFSQNLVIKNVNIIPMDKEQVLNNQTIVVENGLVKTIGNSSEIKLPSSFKIIDAKGKYLMPGMADMHVHLRNSDELVNYLAYGVTTIMHMGGSSSQGRDNLKYSKEIKQGTRIGPKLYTTQRIFDGDPPAAGSAYRISTPELAVELVNELKNKGYDFIKIYNNVSKTVFDAIIKEASRLDLPVVGHIPRKFDALTSINGGQDMIVHTEELFFTYFNGPRSTRNYDKDFEPNVSLVPNLIASIKKNKVAVIPNLSYSFTDLLMWDDVDNILTDSEINYVAPNLVRNEFILGNINRRSNIENFIHRDQKKYQLSLALTYKFQKAGILQLLGTDATQAGLFPGKSAHRELTELVKAGLSNYEALSIATKNAGTFAKENNMRESNFGQIRTGFIADMILVEKNPLKDVRNAKLIDGVITEGKWIPMSEISTLRNKMAAKYSSLKNIDLTIKESLLNKNTDAKIKKLVAENRKNELFLKAIESNINSLGYSFISKKDFDQAIKLFEINTKYFKNSANAWDSLAEAYLLNNDKENAIKNYTKALEVNPQLSSSIDALQKLKND